tara:strand:+ start:76 stop:882 length:807 start_codon:yes stop_codon:yes gene_type:complete
MISNTIIQNVKNNGFHHYPNFIDNGEAKKILKQITSLNSEKGKGKGTTFYNGKRKLIDHAKNLRIKIFFNSLGFINSEINRKFNEISKEILDQSQLRRIDSYISPIDDKPVIDWHNDTSYSGSTQPKKKLHHPNFYKLRFFLYLTDVKFKNGSLACIPKSQKLVRAINKIFYEGKLKYEPYWDLKSFRTLIQKENFKVEILKEISSELYEEFLENTKFVTQNNDTSYYDLESEAGGLVIFDDRAFHRGSSCLETDRAVMRFIYASKLY